MKKTVMKRIMAAMLSGMILIQNASFSVFAQELTVADNSEAVVIEGEIEKKSEETAELSSAPSGEIEEELEENSEETAEPSSAPSGEIEEELEENSEETAESSAAPSKEIEEETEENSEETAKPSTEPSDKLDFSSMRLLVCTEDETALLCSVPTTILSEYEGVYLLSFESEADTREAYYYYSKSCTSAEPDISLFVADNEYLRYANAAESTDALTRLSALLDEDSDVNEYDIALIDTGASGDAVSVISESAEDDNGHGRKMREVISDVSPKLSVLSVKAFDSHGIGSVSSVYAAMCYAMEKNVDVIDLPFAAKSAADSSVLERAVSMANKKGITVIGAAGNNHADAAGYIPGRVSGVIIAGACDDTGLVLASSNYGEAVFCNVAAQSTSEAATRLSAMVAAYGMEQVEAEMGNGIVFKCSETVGDNVQYDKELSATAEDTEEDILPIDETDEEVSEPDFDRKNPPKQEPTRGNGVAIDHVYLRWLSQGEEGSEPFGTLELEPESEMSPNQQFQIDFDLSGQYPYEPGSVRITIPAYLWEGRDGEECGTLTLSVPEDPETGAEFSWKREGDMIVITNVRTLPAASKIMIQGTFRNVDATEIEDETLASFQATVTVTGQNDTISMDSNDISARMNTHINASGADKTAYDGTTGKYSVWWGELPPDMPKEFLQNLPEKESDTENYLFVRWYVSGEAEGNQPFEMTVYDEIGEDNPYGGIMLGISDCAEGYVRSTDGKSVSAKLYDGFSTLPQTAYVWTAYKMDQLPKDPEGDYTTIPNELDIRVVGKDDLKRAQKAGEEPEISKKTAEAEIQIKEPTKYTFTKKWEDNGDIAGHRPEFMDIKIYSKTLGKTTTVRLYPPKEGGNEWTYTWDDNGQSQEFTVQEILSNASGYDMEFYDSDLHQYKWSYYLDKNDPEYKEGEENKWVFPNKYEERWVTPGDGDYVGIGSIKKSSDNPFNDHNKISKRDGLSLNKLMLENDVYVPYTVETVVSAASQYLADRSKETVFALEDKEYILNDNKDLTLADMDIGAVTFFAPKVYHYAEHKAEDGKIPDESEWYKKERVLSPETTLYGLIEGEWKALAVWKTTDKTAPKNDNEYEAGVLEALYPGVTVTGSRVELPKGVAGVKVQLKAAAAFVEFKLQPEVRVHSTANVRDMIEKCYEDGSEYAMIKLYNKANSYAAESEDAQTHYSDQDASGEAYLHGKKYKIAADLNKEYNLTKNDTVKKQLVLHAKIEMTQQSNVLSLEDFRAVASSGEIPYSKGGTYYDLLPRGVEPDLNTITLTNGDRMISVDMKTNYNNSGRTLLIVQVEFAENLLNTYTSKYPKDTYYPTEGIRSSHVLEFDSYLLHDTFRNDKEVDADLHNIAAFEAEEDKIGSITGWQGEKDDPTGKWSDNPEEESTNNHKRTQEAGSPGERDLMKDLDPDRNDPSFVYAGDVVVHNEIDLTAHSSLEKHVKLDGFGSWSTGVGKDAAINVQEGGRYVYRLQVSSARADTRDIIVIDSLENYYRHDGEVGEGIEELDVDKRWHGYLESIDYSAAKAKDIEVVTYYYTGDSRPMVRNYSSKNSRAEVLGQMITDGWTTETPSDMKTVKAVAFDLTTTTKGEPFILKEGESIPIRLYMRAPDHNSDSGENYLDAEEPANPEKNGHAYNEIYMSCSYTEIDPENNQPSNGYSYLYWDYTKVGIYSKEVKVIKAWDDADDADLKRPESVKVWLLANGKRTGVFEELSESNDWTHTFSGLDTYDAFGELITYGVEEEPVGDYTLQTALTYENGVMVITLNNIREPAKTQIPVTKEWDFDDNGNGEDKLPGSITFRLLADGEETGKTLTIKPDTNGKWYGEFTDLVKNKKGKPINYTVEEDPITDFVMSGCVDDGNGGYKVTNKYYPFGDIVLNKIVDGGTQASHDYNLKDGEEHPFLFTLQLYTVDSEGNKSVVTNKYQYYIYDSAKKSEYKTLEAFRKAIEDDEEGKIASDGKLGNADRISLLEGQQIIIKDVPTNVKYTLTETSRKEYELEKTVNDAGSIQSGKAVQAEFTNRYITKGTANIEAWKFLTGRTLSGYQFRFELRDSAGNLIRSANNDASGKVTFNVGYSNADNGKEYIYYLTEADSKMPGYTYDKISYIVKVYPKDKGDGTMTCDVEYFDKDGNKIEVTVDKTVYDKPVFQNEYHADGKVKFVAWKDLDGRVLNKDEFTFELYDEQGDLQDKSTNNENGVITFKELLFTEENAGKTYRFFARELKPAVDVDETVVYDANVICYVVEVIDNGDGTLDFNQSTYILDICKECSGTGKVTIEEAMEKCTKCDGTGYIKRSNSDTPVFKNSLMPGSLSVTKQVGEKTENTENKKFKFNIRLIGDKIKEGMKFTGKDSNGDTVGTYTVDKDGDYTFTVEVGIDQTITFEGIPAGTAYQVWEDDEAGWYLSKREGASGLIAPTETAEAELTNVYDENKAMAIILGTKLLDNKPAHQYNNEIFQFQLLEIKGDEEVPVGDGKPVNATDGGFIQFDIEYTQEGTHNYIIREVIGENKDLVYDEHEEHVKVTVEKDENGFLKATVEYVNTEKDTDNAVHFENYTVPGALQISKVGDGLNDVNDKLFTFEISFFNENGIPLSGEALEYYIVNRDGTPDEQDTPDTGADNSDAEKQSYAGREIISQNDSLEKHGTRSSYSSQGQTAKVTPMTLAAAAGETPAPSGYEPPDADTVSGTKLGEGEIGNSNKVKWRIIETNNSVYLENSKATVPEVVLLIEPEDGSYGELTGDFAWKANTNNYKKVTTILTKGNLSARKVKTAARMFQDCSQLVYADLSNLDLSYDEGDNGEISYLFSGCQNLTDVIFQNAPITGRSDFIGLFLNCTSLQTVENLRIEYSGTQIVNVNEIFSECKSLTSFDLSSWKIETPMSAKQMFNKCSKLGNVTFGENWKHTQLTTMYHMFRECSNLTTIDAPNLNTSQVTDMQLLFFSCTKLQFGENDLKGWETGKVQNFQESFSGCKAVTSLDLSDWDTSSATSMKQMFYECDFTTLKLDNWYVGNVTTMNRMFQNCKQLTGLDLSSWKWSEEGKLTDLQQTFVSCEKMTTLNVTGWNTSAVRTLESTFDNCQMLTDIVGVEDWNTSSVTNMSQTFYKCWALKKDDPNHTLDLSKWETGSVTTMKRMFSMDSTSSNLEKIIVPWDTSNVTDMYNMFNFCTKLKELDLSTWDTSNVTNMERMFAVCWELADDEGTIKGVKNFKTDKVTNMLQMFMECRKVTNLDLSGWNTDRVTTIAQMFQDCRNLEKLDISNFNTLNSVDVTMNSVFNMSEKIKEITFGGSFYASANYTGGKLCNVPTNAPYNGTWVQKDQLNLFSRNTYTSQELMDMLKANPSLQATTYVWDTQNYYTVEFKCGTTEEVSGEMTDGRCDPDADFILPDNKFTRYGYVFTGWWDEANDTKYTPGDDGKITIPAKTYENKAKIILTALWTKYDTTKGLPYYVDVYKEKPDDDDTKTADSKYYLDYSLIFFIKDPTVPTKITMPDDTIDEPFYVAPEAKEYEISSASGIVRIPLYYDLKRFTIKFDPNADSVTGTPMSDIELIGDASCIFGNTYINGSKRFVGWNTQKDGNGLSFGAGNSYTINDFEFKQGGSITLYAIWLDNSTTITPTAGKITVQCRAGEMIVFPNLPAGTTYTVKEINLPSGWEWVTSEDDKLTEDGSAFTGTIISNQYVQVQAVNVYRATGGGILQAHKRYDGDTLQQGDFTFDLYTLSDAQCSYTENYHEDGSFVGVVTPHITDEDIVTVEGAEKILVVLHYNTEDKTKASVEVLGEKDELLHTFKGSGTEYLSINGNTVKFKANCDEGTADYHATVYKVTAIDTAMNGSPDQLAEIQDETGKFVTNDWYNTGLVTFTMQNYTEPGEYVYYIREQIGSDKKIDYDEHIVKAVVTVTDSGDGSFATQVDYYDLDENMNAKKASGALFVNKKKTGQLVLEKTLIDASGAVGDTPFEFMIHLNDTFGNPLNGTFGVVEGDYTEPSDSTDPPKAKEPLTITFENGEAVLTIKGGERFTIIGLPDGATYFVEEKKLTYFEQTGASGTKGKIESNTTSEVSITNTYSISDELQITAMKNFIGGDLGTYTFNFELLDHAHTVIQTAQCDSQGVITFAKIEFTEADIGRDIFYYIREVKGEESNIQYDTEEKCVRIHVGKGEENQIQLEVYVLDPKTGQYNVPYADAGQLMFTNVFLYDLTVSKSVTDGPDDPSKKFKFTLTLENRTYPLPENIICKTGSVIQERQLDENGRLTFELSPGETITFSGLPLDTKYTVTESEDEDYTATITVSGDESPVINGGTVSGTLKANVTAAYLNTYIFRAELPGSGGTGTAMLYVFGAVLTAFGLLYIILRRRRSENKTDQ